MGTFHTGARRRTPRCENLPLPQLLKRRQQTTFPCALSELRAASCLFTCRLIRTRGPPGLNCWIAFYRSSRLYVVTVPLLGPGWCLATSPSPRKSCSAVIKADGPVRVGRGGGGGGGSGTPYPSDLRLSCVTTRRSGAEKCAIRRRLPQQILKTQGALSPPALRRPARRCALHARGSFELRI